MLNRRKLLSAIGATGLLAGMFGTRKPVMASDAPQVPEVDSRPLRMLRATPNQEEAVQQLSPGEHLWLGGNRSGVTTAGAIAVSLSCGLQNVLASDRVFERLMGRSDVHASGRCWHYPRRVMCVSTGLHGVGDTLYRVLFKPIYSHNQPALAPLIRKKDIDIRSYDWYDKRSREIKSVKLHNGATIDFFSSAGIPVRKDTDFPYDFIWIDCEPVSYEAYLRAVDWIEPHQGALVVTSWPSVGGAVEEVYNRPGVKIRRFRLSENPHINPSAIALMKESLSAEEAARRLECEF